jgi:hypothetical protein
MIWQGHDTLAMAHFDIMRKNYPHPLLRHRGSIINLAALSPLLRMAVLAVLSCLCGLSFQDCLITALLAVLYWQSCHSNSEFCA